MGEALLDKDVERPMGEIIPGSLCEETELLRKGFLLSLLDGDCVGEGKLAACADFPSAPGRKDVPGPVSADGSGILSGSSKYRVAYRRSTEAQT